MRDIKFRGKTILNGMWIEGCYQRLVIDGVMRHFILSDDFLFFDDIKLIAALTEVHPETVGQFTGLKDINDIEIYEGDITQTFFADDPVSNIVIRFRDCMFGFSSVDKKYTYFSQLNKYEIKEYNFRIIGNIHDNPELIDKL